MRHHILFITRDATEDIAVRQFISNFKREHCLIVNHMRKKGVSHLSELINCEGRLRIAIIPACLTEHPACFNLLKFWYDTNLEDAPEAIEAILESLQRHGENVNESILIKHSDSAASAIDHLLDNLATPDFAKLHIVVDEELLPYWRIGETCDYLSGTLLRAVIWEKAVFYPLRSDRGRTALEDWAKCLGTSIVITPEDRVVFSSRFEGKPLHFALELLDEDLVSTNQEKDSCEGGSTRWSNNIEVIRSVSLQSIPIHYFAPRLNMYSTDTEISERFRISDNECLLLRINGTEVPGRESEETDRSSDKFWKAVASGDLKCPATTRETPLSMHIAVTAQGQAYPLVYELDLDFLSCFQPYYPTPLPQAKGLPLLEEYEETVVIDPHSNLADPSEWPQRGLLAYEPPPINHESNVLALSAPVIVALFGVTTGRAIDNVEDPDPIQLENLSLRPTLNTEEAKTVPWPEILKHTCHDVYYNRSGEDEAWERHCQRWRDAAIRHPFSNCLGPESTTTCILRQKSSTLRQSPRKNLFEGSPQGRRRSPRKVKSPKRNSSQILRRNPFRDILREVSNATQYTKTACAEQAERNAATQSTHSKRLRARPFSQSDHSFSDDAQSAAKRMRTDTVDNEKLKRKLREAVATSLEELGIDLKHKWFTTCGKKLFTICRTFAVDLIGTGRTSQILLNIARSHAKQVVDFEKSLKGSTQP